MTSELGLAFHIIHAHISFSLDGTKELPDMENDRENHMFTGPTKQLFKVMLDNVHRTLEKDKHSRMYIRM